jgi:hypothetical protein
LYSVGSGFVGGVIRGLSIGDFDYLLVRYGDFYQQVWGTNATLRNLIESKTTEEELNAITISF